MQIRVQLFLGASLNLVLGVSFLGAGFPGKLKIVTLRSLTFSHVHVMV